MTPMIVRMSVRLFVRGAVGVFLDKGVLPERQMLRAEAKPAHARPEEDRERNQARTTRESHSWNLCYYQTERIST